MAKLAETRYGKAHVRLMKVTRHPDRHEVAEWDVNVMMEGDFETCFTEGDNTNILPTDTMKNTVYFVARSSSAPSMEDFAMELVRFFLDGNNQIETVNVQINERIWEHVEANGKARPTTFRQSGPAEHTVSVTGSRNRPFEIKSGIKGLVILKTTKSGFVGYIKNPLTTLQETTDRLFGTEAAIVWTYEPGNLLFSDLRKQILNLLLSSFAEHDSLSGQHTLFAMGSSVLDAFPSVAEIELSMPNRHCLLVDLARFGLDNPNEIFVPTDEPHGAIAAKIRRE